MRSHLVGMLSFLIVGVLVSVATGAEEPRPRASSVCSKVVTDDTISLTCATTPRLARIDQVTAGYDQIAKLARIGFEVNGDIVTIDLEKSGRGQSPGPTPGANAREGNKPFEEHAVPNPEYWSEGPVTFWSQKRISDPAVTGPPVEKGCDAKATTGDN